jgi:hypothetical protein
MEKLLARMREPRFAILGAAVILTVGVLLCAGLVLAGVGEEVTGPLAQIRAGGPLAALAWAFYFITAPQEKGPGR